jgi:F-type H+-transporting ATPase subunit b
MKKLLSCGLLWLLLLAPSFAFANDEGHGEHIGAANAGEKLEDPVDVKADLAFFTAIVFLLLMVILKKFAWGPITEALEKREHNIAQHLEAAAQKHEEAKGLLAQYEQKLGAAAAQIKGMMDGAHRDAQATKADILAEAKKGADAERNRALHEIEAATDASLKQLAEHGANLAVELAGKIVQSKLNKDDHSKLIADTLRNLPSSSLN